MTPLNTIIEEEKKEFTEKFSYGGFGGLIPQHRDGGRILMEEVWLQCIFFAILCLQVTIILVHL